MKNIPLLVVIAGISVACSAENMPAVGLLELVPVVGKDMHVQARPSYVFTNTKLSSSTIFTGLQTHGTVTSAICCFEVSNLNAISVTAELSKYSYDPDFVAHMKSIKGYSYVYASHPAPKALWNPFMKNITPDVRDPMDSQIFSAPVIAATIRKDLIPETFEVNQKKVSLKTDYKKNPDKGVYTFIIDGQRTSFSEELPSTE